LRRHSEGVNKSASEGEVAWAIFSGIPNCLGVGMVLTVGSAYICKNASSLTSGR